MGNDGGSISVRDDLVKVKARAEKVDPDAVRKGLWTLCALSRKPLRTPVVSDQLGRLYNKEAVVEYLLQRSQLPAGSSEHTVAGHIRGLKDITQLKLTSNPSFQPPSPSRAESDSDAVPFLCPLTFRPMDGVHRFVYVASCGCVMSESGLRAIVTAPSSNGKRKHKDSPDETTDTYPCPLCGNPFSAPGFIRSEQRHAGKYIVPLNPSTAEQEELRQAMEESRQAARKRKSKKTSGGEHGKEPASNNKSPEAQQRAQIAALAAVDRDAASSSPLLSNEGSKAASTPLKKKAKAI